MALKEGTLHGHPCSYPRKAHTTEEKGGFLPECSRRLRCSASRNLTRACGAGMGERRGEHMIKCKLGEVLGGTPPPVMGVAYRLKLRRYTQGGLLRGVFREQLNLRALSFVTKECESFV